MSSIKQANRFRIFINSIRQRSNFKWKQISNIYSKFLIRFSWSILVISSFISIGLTICFLLFMKIRSFDQNDFLILNSPALKNAHYLRKIFGNDTELRMHQQLNLYPGLDIIIKRKFNINQTTNMLSNEILDEIHLLDKQIQSIRINNSIEYNYTSLCTRINHACIIDGNYILTDKFRQDFSHLLFPKYGYYFDPSGANGIPDFMFGKNYQLINITEIHSDYDEHTDEDDNDDEIIEANLEKIISHVPLFRLRYSLNTSTLEMKQRAIQWEQQALKYLNEEYHSELIDLFPSTSTAINDIITKKAHEEGLYITLMIIIFFIIYYFILIIQGNSHTSVGYLPLCGILSIGFSTGATFGLLSIFNIEIIEPMTLLVFIIIIIDCMRFSIICGEYHRIINEHLITIHDTKFEIDIEKLFPLIIESTHPYFLISTLIISFIYLLFSLITCILSIKFICLTLVLYIFINYIIYITFFSSSLVITLKRLSSRRHYLCCYRLSNDYYKNLSSKKFLQLKLLKTRFNLFLNQNIIWKKLFASFSCLIFISSIISSIWFCLSIDTNLFDKKFLPSDSYSLRKYMEFQINEFNIGPVIMLTIPESINYENEQVKLEMNLLINQCQKEKSINKFKLLWLDHENIEYIINGKDDLQLRITPFSQNDLIIEQKFNYSIIKSSRFYCQYKSIKGDREDIQTMNNMYTYTNQNLLPYVFPYSLLFPIYESLEQIRIEMYLLIIIFLISTFLILLITFLSFRNCLLILLNLFLIFLGTLTCLDLFHTLTFNFMNIIWLYIIPIIFLETLIHQIFHKNNKKWYYNRIIISLILSLVILYFYPIQSYIFQIIRNSLIYQSIICLILINIILPSWNYLFQSMKHDDDNNNEKINNVIIQPTISSIEGNQLLKNDLEINRIINSSI